MGTDTRALDRGLLRILGTGGLDIGAGTLDRQDKDAKRLNEDNLFWPWILQIY